MPYASIDSLQRELASNVFHYTSDSKKAAGRALGTLVEIITFYLIKSWGLEKNVAIERRLPEYANPGITHNVEFSFHPSTELGVFAATESDLPLTAKKIHKLLGSPEWANDAFKSNQLVSKNNILRNGCTIHENSDRIIIARLAGSTSGTYQFSIHDLNPHPFGVVECKRVGVEEGNKKGPQTIEKAKQGAYVARTVSSLQKVRMNNGEMYGVLHLETGELRYEPYRGFLQTVVQSDEKSLLGGFIFTVGVVSNHGNWFTAEDHNKELQVLANSYDWLVFLTDAGLCEFVQSLIINPDEEFLPIKNAFHASYNKNKKGNQFTKVKIALEADSALRSYFSKNICKAEGWFNVIGPTGSNISGLRNQMNALSSKNWEAILR